MISHDHKTVFIHIPKCAGQSVETAFLTDLGLSWETRAPFLLRPNDNPQLGPPRLAHLIATDYVRYHYMSSELYQAYYSFAIIRDPWARTVSLYRHLNLNMSFGTFVTRYLPHQFDQADSQNSFWFVRPQADYVISYGKLVVDDLVRFENLSEEFGPVAIKAGLQSSLPHVNSSQNRKAHRSRSLAKRLRQAAGRDERDRYDHWTEYFDAKLIAEIAELYAVDVESFGYQAPSREREN